MLCVLAFLLFLVHDAQSSFRLAQSYRQLCIEMFIGAVFMR